MGLPRLPPPSLQTQLYHDVQTSVPVYKQWDSDNTAPATFVKKTAFEERLG